MLSPALAIVAVAGTGSAQRPGQERLAGRANPSAVISAELAMSRIAREMGAAEALHRQAAPSALVLANGPIPAETWFKQRGLPSSLRRWSPGSIMMSCDGGIAAVQGRWRDGAGTGRYFAIWQRQANGGWRWLLHEDGPTEEILIDDLPDHGEPQVVAGKVAECANLPKRPAGFVPPPANPLEDASRDGSLEWTIRLSPQCGVTGAVKAWDGRAMAAALTWTRPEPVQGCD